MTVDTVTGSTSERQCRGHGVRGTFAGVAPGREAMEPRSDRDGERDTCSCVGHANDIELVRRTFEAYLTAAPEAAFEYLHPDLEFDATLRPDGKVWHGREGARRALVEWSETWDDFELEVERYLDAGDGRVVVLWNERGRAKASGVPLLQSGVTVCTVRDGLIVAMVIGVDRRRTLKAMGLAPS
jgi:ketosteroid isomerase-like protein